MAKCKNPPPVAPVCKILVISKDVKKQRNCIQYIIIMWW